MIFMGRLLGSLKTTFFYRNDDQNPILKNKELKPISQKIINFSLGKIIRNKKINFFSF